MISRTVVAAATMGAWFVVVAGCTNPAGHEHTASPLDVDPEYLVYDSRCTSTSGPLRIKGPAGRFELYDVTDDAILHRGTMPTLREGWASDETDSASWHEIDLAVAGIELVAGHEYRIQGPGGSTPHSTPILPHIRYGQGQFAEILGKRYHAGPGNVLTWMFAIGEYRGVDGSFEADSLDADGESFTVYLSLAVVPPGHEHPVVRLSEDSWLLDAALTIRSGREEIRTYTMPLEPYLALDIPKDPDLVGSHVLLQWLFAHDDSQTTIWSDVFGTTILDELDAEEFRARSPIPTPDKQAGAAGAWLDALRASHGDNAVPLSTVVPSAALHK